MKLGTVEHAGRPRAVIGLGGDEVLLLPEEITDVGALAAQDGEEFGAWTSRAMRRRERLDSAGLSWLPPVTRPGKILCVALNNTANPARIISGPHHPAMFVKPSTALVGHREAIRLRLDDGRVHPEPELAVIIGSTARGVSTAKALDHVFGYSVLNDITAPDLRAKDTFHYQAIHPDPDSADGLRHVESWVSYPARYKGSDSFAPLGPWVVPATSIRDPHALRVTCSYDGVVVTDDSTANLRFSVAEVIAFASRYTTLEPGDVIGMGTALQPSNGGGAIQNVDLHDGGRVEVSIEAIGTLVNPVQRS